MFGRTDAATRNDSIRLDSEIESDAVGTKITLSGAYRRGGSGGIVSAMARASGIALGTGDADHHAGGHGPHRQADLFVQQQGRESQRHEGLQ